MITEGRSERVRGALHALLLFDVAEEIDLESARTQLGQSPGARSPAFRLPAPEYVRFERPPVVVRGDPIKLASGEEFGVTIKFYDYGVLSVGLKNDYELDWGELVSWTPGLIGSQEIEQKALDAARRGVEMVRGALRKPAEAWMSEDYCAVHIREFVERPGLPAEYLISERGADLARMVRGEPVPLAESEQREVLRGLMSYYPSDLLVAGWTAAVIYDTDEGAEGTLQLLEYANTQLLEFRFYDELLTGVLREVYQKLEEHRGLFARWRLAREAARLNALRLDVMELAERADNALKFIGDMYYARAYRLAAERVGVGDYRRLVDEKLRTAGDLYTFMVNEFHQGRAFVMEAAIVLILIIDLYFIFKEAKLF
jgi:hypothetical protein